MDKKVTSVEFQKMADIHFPGYLLEVHLISKLIKKWMAKRLPCSCPLQGIYHKHALQKIDKKWRDLLREGIFQAFRLYLRKIGYLINQKGNLSPIWLSYDSDDSDKLIKRV